VRNVASQSDAVHCGGGTISASAVLAAPERREQPEQHVIDASVSPLG
jgi:hypothetical protein